MKSSFEAKPLPAESRSGFVPALVADASTPATERLELPSPPLESLEPVAQTVPPPPVAPDPTPVLEAVAAFESAALQLREQQREEHRRWLWGALDVSVALAERVLERELSIDPAALHPLLERALELIGEDEPIEVALAPAGLESLGGALNETIEGLRERCGVSLLSDSRLAAGEARVSSGASRVELRVETLLSMLRDELVPQWEQAGEDA
jgi:hypothetical protein